ncbi:hypothetical protein DPEC_G00155070 [Dallia pectoralis]|uniref:Uncharacterized protein n=1 Tax=Dallia pectoralis TaxID=75939 RepID=A0ACC2GKL5_DALPE|nr:hypothetical protein DPEC_G00155070 [Dallia pectoralis]
MDLCLYDLCDSTLCWSSGLHSHSVNEHGSLEKTNNITTMWLKGLLIGSGVLIAFLIGLVSVMWKRTAVQKTPDSHPNSEPPGCPDEQEYSLLQLPPSSNQPRPEHSDSCTYSDVRIQNTELIIS